MDNSRETSQDLGGWPDVPTPRCFPSGYPCGAIFYHRGEAAGLSTAFKRGVRESTICLVQKDAQSDTRPPVKHSAWQNIVAVETPSYRCQSLDPAES